MEKAKKRFNISLLVFIITGIIFLIAPTIETKTGEILGKIIAIIGWAAILGIFVSFIMGFYFLLVSKEIKGIRLFLNWFIANLAFFIIGYMAFMIPSIIRKNTYKALDSQIALIVMLISTALMIVITGIISLIIYFKKKKEKQNGQ